MRLGFGSKARARAAALIALSGACAACGLIIDLNDRPPRPATNASDGGDAAATCPPPGATGFCAQQCAKPPFGAPLFCDDFEEQGSIARWNAPGGSTNTLNPLHIADGSLEFAEAPLHGNENSNQASLAKGISPTYQFTGAMLVSWFDTKRALRGIHVSTTLQLKQIDYYDADFDRTSLRAVSTFGIGNKKTLNGVTLGFISEGSAANVQALILQEHLAPLGDDFKAVKLGAVASTARGTIQDTWLMLEMTVGTPEVLRSVGMDCDEPNEALRGTTHAALKVPILPAPACVPLQEDLADTNWYADGAWFLGGVVTGFGTVAVYTDNFVVHGIE